MASMARFSLKKLLFAMLQVAAGSACLSFVFSIPVHTPFKPWNPFCWYGGGALIGAGLFVPTKRPVIGAVIGVFIQICLLWVLRKIPA
jgi:hypothetical protein